MKRKLIYFLAGVLLGAALLLGAARGVGPNDIGYSVGDAVRNFPEIVVVNTETGCTANYFEAAGRWRVWAPDGTQVFQGVEGAAMHALLFMCP